ncbi:MAG: pimeloyl-ACP methyl ester esterase BioH [Nitrosomonas sp.]|nr:pimeloyl-ACP methyl ester esterase BioH [Nitrosomonas sp.]MDP1950186.1 pimeloyl-ACP methyl ester esterase BioH [Nitrosomonas sp.]
MRSLHVETLGSGPDLVLLHGWAMHSGIWDSVRHQLAQDYRLHLVDLPGHGLSPACKPGSLESMVEMVAEILPENCIVGGWSLGGQIAIELALQKPDRITKLVLISTTPCFIKREDWQWGMNATILQLFSQNLAQNYVNTLNRFLTLQLSGGNDSKAVLAKLRKNFFQYSQPDSAALQTGLEILLTSDLREKFVEIKQPVLLLHGEKDVITDVAAASWMNQQLPDSKLIMFPNCGHAPFLSFPLQFVTSLHELRSHTG